MKMTDNFGITFIEVIIFITLAGLLVSVAFISVSKIIGLSVADEQMMTAQFVAEERMELILGQKQYLGYYGFQDPCGGEVSPINCEPVNPNCLVSVDFTSFYRSGTEIKVKVTGCGEAMLTSYLGRY